MRSHLFLDILESFPTVYSIEAEPFAVEPLGVEAVDQISQLHRLVFALTPQPLDEDVVHAAAATILGDRDPGRLEYSRDMEVGQLAALIDTEDPLLAIRIERLVQRLYNRCRASQP